MYLTCSFKSAADLDSCEKFDVANAERALAYLSECEKIGQVDGINIGQLASEANDRLRKSLEAYGSYLQKAIADKYNRICNTKSVQDDPYQHSHGLHVRITELQQLANRHPLIYEHMINNNNNNNSSHNNGDQIEGWRTRISNFYVTQRRRMNQLQDTDIAELRNQVLVAEALACMDSFCGLDGKGFDKLYTDYNLILRAKMHESCQRLLASIAADDYAQADMILAMDGEAGLSQNTIIQIKHELSASVQRLIGEAKRKTHLLERNVEKEDKTELVQQLKELMARAAMASNREALVKMLNAETRQLLLAFAERMHARLLEVIASALKSVDIFIKTHSFLEAERAMANIDLIEQELIISTQERQQMSSECAVEQQRRALRTSLDDIVKILMKRDFADIGSYSISSPKELLAKIRCVAEHGNHVYIEAETIMLTEMRKSFVALIDELTTTRGDELTTQHKKQRIRELKHALTFLPNEISADLEHKLANIEESIILHEKQAIDEFQTTLEIDDSDELNIQSLAERLQHYKDNHMTSFHAQLVRQILKTLNAYQAQVSECLSSSGMQQQQQQHVHAALACARKVATYRRHMGEHVTSIETVYKNVCNSLKRTLSSCSTTLASMNSVESAECVEQAYKIMLEIVSLTFTLDNNNNNNNNNENEQQVCVYFVVYYIFVLMIICEKKKTLKSSPIPLRKKIF